MFDADDWDDSGGNKRIQIFCNGDYQRSSGGGGGELRDVDENPALFEGKSLDVQVTVVGGARE